MGCQVDQFSPLWQIIEIFYYIKGLTYDIWMCMLAIVGMELTGQWPTHSGGYLMSKRTRFWVYTTSPVQVTLQAGQTLHHSYGGETDEGWSRESNTWSFDGETITNQWCSDGRDCDGRLTRTGERWFAHGNEHKGYVDVDDIAYPLWEQGPVSQRDEYAEAAGY